MVLSCAFQAPDELEGLTVGLLAALLAGAAGHDGGLVEEAGGQVAQGPLGLRQGHHGLAVDLAGGLETGLGSEVMVGAGPCGGCDRCS